jgi:multidrug efflux system membrane fusion protein
VTPPTHSPPRPSAAPNPKSFPLPAGPGHRPPETAAAAPADHSRSAASRGRSPYPWLLGAIAVVLVAGCVWWIRRPDPAAESGTGRGTGRAGAARTGPLSVAVVSAKKGDVSVYLTGLGTVVPLVNVTVRAQISGQLVREAVAEGQMVNRGDLLAVVDPRPYEVALEQAEGQLKQAQSELKDAQIDAARYATLERQDSIARQQVDKQFALVTQYEGLVQTSQSAVDGAKLSLEYCHITAPVAGRLGLWQVDPGNYVTSGDANGLATLTQVKPITVVFSLPEDDVPEVAARLRSGANLPVDAYDRTQTRKLATGSLVTIDNQVDPTTGTFRLRARFANGDESLFSNQFVNVRMLIEVQRGAIVIPASAVERGQQGTYVYVIKPDHTAAARPVTLGPTEGERVAVTAGLDPGELVVTDGADRLRDGIAVTVQGAAPGRRRRAGAAGDEPAPGGKGGIRPPA